MIFASMYLALLLRMDVSDEDDAEQEAFSAVLIAAHAVTFIVVTAQTVMSCKGWRRPAVSPSPMRSVSVVRSPRSLDDTPYPN